MLSKTRYATAATAAWTFLGFLTVGCSSNARDRGYHINSGFAPELQSSLQLWPDQNTVVTTNNSSHTLEQFTLAPPAHVQTLTLPRPESGQIALPSADSGYYVTVSSFGYAVVKAAAQTATVDPLVVPGLIMAVAFAPSQGHLALLDDQQNIVLATISSNGDVTDTWKTTAQLPNKEWAVTSTMLADGTLLLATSGNHIAVVDVAASVTEQTWKETDVAVLGATDLKWVAGVQGLANNTALVLDANRLVVVDLKTATVLDQKSLGSAEILGTYRDLTPHLRTQTQDEVQPGTNDITYVNSSGKLTTFTVAGPAGDVLTTLFDPQGATVAIADTSLALNRYHTADGSALDSSTFDRRVRLSLRVSSYLEVYRAALGKAEVRTYGPSPAVAELVGYDYPTAAAQSGP